MTRKKVFAVALIVFILAGCGGVQIHDDNLYRNAGKLLAMAVSNYAPAYSIPLRQAAAMGLKALTDGSVDLGGIIGDTLAVVQNINGGIPDKYAQEIKKVSGLLLDVIRFDWNVPEKLEEARVIVMNILAGILEGSPWTPQ